MSSGQRYTVIDVETANSERASICQVAIVTFDGSTAVDSWHSFVNPDCHFEYRNVQIHGINQEHVRGAPGLAAALTQIERRLKGSIVASHGHFDQGAIDQACDRVGRPRIDCRWLNTVLICRRTWPQFRKGKCDLKSVADSCGIGFKHHDALADAHTAGLVLGKAITETGVSVEDWLILSRQPIPKAMASIKKKQIQSSALRTTNSGPVRDGGFLCKLLQWLRICHTDKI